jgi:hypothetical protein
MSDITQAIEKAVREQMVQVEAQLEYEAEKFGATAGRRY